MKVPDVRLYRESDFEDVVRLLREAGSTVPDSHDELWGIALIAHDEKIEHGPPIAFIWALVAEGSPVAYIDYFVVAKGYEKSSVGAVLGMALIRFLQRVNIRKIFAVTPPWNKSFMKTMLRHGAVDLGPHHVLVADIAEEIGEGVGDEVYEHVSA